MIEPRSRPQGVLALLLLALCSVLTLAVTCAASAREAPVVVGPGFGVTFNGGVVPKRLSATQPTPVGLALSMTASGQGSHLPPVTELGFAIDRHVQLHLKGLSVCAAPRIKVDEGGINNCEPAQIGHGKIHVSIAFPETEELQSDAALRIFNGGRHGGEWTLWGYAEIRVPSPAAIVLHGVIRERRQGAYGSEVLFAVPKIAGGSGSLTAFNATIRRTFAYRGEATSVLTSTCPSGALFLRGWARFADGTSANGKVPRTCSPAR
jgi:hypothetical protein